MAHRSPVATVLRHASCRPDAVAYVRQGEPVSYSRFARDIDLQAARLAKLGVAAGDRIVLSPESTPQAGYLLACRLYALNYLGAAALVVTPDVLPARRAERIAALRARRIDDTWSAGGEGGMPVRADHPDGPTYYRFSTGSTGEPKAVLLTNAQLCSAYEAAARALGLGPEDRFLPAVPMPHPVALRGMFRIHAAGGAMVDETLPRTPRELAALIGSHGITCVHVSAAQLRTLLAAQAPDAAPLPPAAKLLLAGAPITEDERATVRSRFSANLWIDYASTEVASMAVNTPEDAPGSGLRLVEGVEAEVLDDQGRALPFGEAGELRVRSPWTPQGYVLGESEGLRGGWFHPGDRAKLVSPGRIALLGRVDELINRGGLKISPREAEAALGAHPAVREVAVVGVPDPVSGELPVAFVVLRDQAALASLEAHCRARIEEARLPAAYVSVREIPRSAEGKVLRTRLRELVRPV